MNSATQEILSVIVPIVKKYPVNRAALFGSYARNEQTPESDIDLLLDLGTNESYPELYYVFDLLNEMEAETGKKVDYVTVAGLESSPVRKLKANIDSERVWFYGE